MRRADRRDKSDDNSTRYLRSQQQEPESPKALKQRLLTVQSLRQEAETERDTLKQMMVEVEQRAEQTHHLYLEEQQKREQTLVLYENEQKRYQSALVLHQEEKQALEVDLTRYQQKYQDAEAQYQSYFDLYKQETARTSALQLSLEETQSDRDRYITLYDEAQADLKFERRSKAGIKGWETRRKKENQRLKQEIGEMTLLLRDSIERRDVAIGNLEALADRMDRIQNLVDFTEDGPNTPLSLLEKFRRIVQSVREILAE